MSPPSFGAAARILAERDPVIARLVADRRRRFAGDAARAVRRAAARGRAVAEQDGVAAGSGGQGAGRDRGAVPARAGPGERRRDHRAAELYAGAADSALTR